MTRVVARRIITLKKMAIRSTTNILAKRVPVMPVMSNHAAQSDQQPGDREIRQLFWTMRLKGEIYGQHDTQPDRQKQLGKQEQEIAGR